MTSTSNIVNKIIEIEKRFDENALPTRDAQQIIFNQHLLSLT
jgi:hypothetical protein